MKVTCLQNERELQIFLSGELDHHSARQGMDQITELIDTRRPLTCSLDFGEVGFMDSSGIALILSAMRAMQHLGGHLAIHNVPNQAMRVLTAAKVDRLVSIHAKAAI